jgi:hypothetical protein
MEVQHALSRRAFFGMAGRAALGGGTQIVQAGTRENMGRSPRWVAHLLGPHGESSVIAGQACQRQHQGTPS